MTTQQHRYAAPAALQLAAATVDGLALSTIVLHVTEDLGLPPGATGLVLSGAAVAALVLAGPLGALADRVGLRRAGAVATAGSAFALLGYAVADSLVVYAVSAVVFVVSQSTSGAIRQALAAAGAPATERSQVRATMHTLLNVGLGVGTVTGAGLVALGSSTALRMAYVGGAALSLVASAVLLGLRGVDAGRAAAAPPGGLALVLRDRRFVTATALASLVQLTMPTLSVLLPVWVLRDTAAPAWTAGAALGLNTALVILAQRPWTRRLTDDCRVVRSARLAAGALVAAGAGLALAGRLDRPAAAVLAVGLSVATLTAGEVAGGAATWSVALRDVPPHAEGRYQSVFAMSANGARILGPAVALPLVVSQPTAGWLVLGLVMAGACLGISRLAVGSARPAHSWSPPDTPAPVLPTT